MIVQTRYRDAEFEDVDCPHTEPLFHPQHSRARWAELRGTPIAFDSETFQKGDCDLCDSWLVVPERRHESGRRFCVVRGHIEIGD